LADQTEVQNEAGKFMEKLSSHQSDQNDWTKFNKRALHNALQKESPENRADLIEEFQEKWNDGKLIIYLNST
jgi:hypothetical protein